MSEYLSNNGYSELTQVRGGHDLSETTGGSMVLHVTPFRPLFQFTV